MKIFLYFPLILSMVFLLPVYADDGLSSNNQQEQQATNLNKDLMPEDNVEVRSYARDNGDQITEYSVNGRVYAIRVQPIADLPAYYLYDSDGNGSFEQRLPGGYKRISPPMWVIKKF